MANTLHNFLHANWPALVAVVSWLLPSPLTSLPKGKITMQTIFFAIRKFVLLVVLVVTLVEDFAGPGDGPAKKVKALADIKGQLPALADGVGLPAWALDMLMNDQLLGLVIDAVVAIGNSSGVLPKAAPAVPTQAEPVKG